MLLVNSQTDVLTRQAGMRLSLFLFVALILIMILPGSVLAEVSATLNRNTIYTGETVTLQITATGSEKSARPDLKPLRKNFEIIGTGSSTQIQIINGHRTDKQVWQIELAPLKSGSIEVPSLTIGNSKTASLSLKVKQQPTAKQGHAGQDVLVRTEISPTPGTTYVQQQILYTVRLYYKIPLIEGNLTEPEIDNAVIERLGNDTQYNTTLNGQNYQVIERQYAIFPERSGELTIKPIIFSGRTPTSGQAPSLGNSNSIIEHMLKQRGFNDSFFNNTPFGDPGKRVRVKSNETRLNIKPRPNNYSGQHWLPTEKLTLADSWETSPPVIHAGEPITRTLTLEAKGLEASQLPELKRSETETLNIYAEQAKLTNRTDGDWIYGRSEQLFTYVASKAGNIHIPAIQVTWWDPINQQQRDTVLPARDLTVLPGSTQSTPAANKSDLKSVPADTADQTTQTTTANKAPVSDQQTTDKYQHYWLAASGILLLILLVAYFIWRKLKSLKPSSQLNNQEPLAKSPMPSNEVSLQQIHSKLRAACDQSMPDMAAQVLLDWARIIWPQQPPRSLGSLAQHLDKHTETIYELESALYGSNHQPWQGQKLWKAFNDGLLQNQDKDSAKQGTINTPPLYPDWEKYAK